MEDITVQVIDMDVMIPEHVVKTHDGSFTIFLNARYSHEYMLKSYQHAVEHIENGDFDRDCGCVQEIETIAHEEKPVATTPIPVPVPDPVITVAENIKQPTTKRRKRKRNRKQERYAMDRAEFIAEYCDSFALAEHQWLYGKDL